MTSESGGPLGMIPFPSTLPYRKMPGRSPQEQRWVDALEDMHKCLTEARVDCHLANRIAIDGSEASGLEFPKGMPTREVLLKAGEVCGIRDLIELMFDGLDS